MTQIRPVSTLEKIFHQGEGILVNEGGNAIIYSNGPNQAGTSPDSDNTVRRVGSIAMSRIGDDADNDAVINNIGTVVEDEDGAGDGHRHGDGDADAYKDLDDERGGPGLFSTETHFDPTGAPTFLRDETVPIDNEGSSVASIHYHEAKKKRFARELKAMLENESRSVQEMDKCEEMAFKGDNNLQKPTFDNPILTALLHPHTIFYDVRQWVVLLVTFWNCLYVPVAAFFDPSVGSILAMQVFNAMVDLIFITDLVLNFYTAYINPWGQVIWSPLLIRNRYLRGQFTFDLLACIPLEFLATAGGHGAGTQINTLFRLMRVFRFHRLYTSDKFQSQILHLRLLRLLFFLLLVCHWMGAIFFALGR